MVHTYSAALKSRPMLVFLVLLHVLVVFGIRSLHFLPGAVVVNKLLAVPERQFPHEHFTNFTDKNHTHYMDPWGFDVLCNYKSHMTVNNFPSDSITLVSQMVLDDLREQRLLDLASRWSGLISIAIYFAHDTTFKASTLEEAMKVIDWLRAKYSIVLQNVHFHVVVNKGREIDYPINLLRNIALNNARTDYVLLVDADFIPSANAHDSLLLKFKIKPELMYDGKALLILPAFERRLGHDEKASLLTSNDLPSTKGSLLKQMEDHPERLDIFHKTEFEPGHKPTNFPLWYNASDMYLVKYQFHFEPYYVIRKSPTLPPFGNTIQALVETRLHG
jgi:glycosyltransferase involved in cell wall biosynthesis